MHLWFGLVYVQTGKRRYEQYIWVGGNGGHMCGLLVGLVGWHVSKTVRVPPLSALERAHAPRPALLLPPPSPHLAVAPPGRSARWRWLCFAREISVPPELPGRSRPIESTVVSYPHLLLAVPISPWFELPGESTHAVPPTARRTSPPRFGGFFSTSPSLARGCGTSLCKGEADLLSYAMDKLVTGLVVVKEVPFSQKNQ
ncbi:hypothetical protein ABZP36_016342 [Zizania latifolia]